MLLAATSLSCTALDERNITEERLVDHNAHVVGSLCGSGDGINLFATIVCGFASLGNRYRGEFAISEDALTNKCVSKCRVVFNL